MKTYKWQHIQFADGSNPYICTSKEAFDYMNRKYNLTKLSESEMGTEFWLAEDKKNKIEYMTRN